MSKKENEILEENFEELEDIYSGRRREEMLDSDEISGEEEAFMQGYEEA